MWDLKIIDTDKPLYIAIVEAIEQDIHSGALKPGEKLPTHRELAKKVGVAVTTITRAYKEAEKRGMITAIVGNGTFVTADLGAHSYLVKTESRDGQIIEMGTIVPLYAAENGLDDVIKRILLKSNLNLLMKYSSPQGLPWHRKTGASWVKRFGIDTTPDKIIITVGTQHAINCIFSSLFQSGDRIAADCFTYPGIKAAARRCGLQLDGIAMDEEGMIPSELGAACKRHNIKGIYTMANMQNPTNAIMSARRRREICKVIKENNLLLIEDDTYGFLLTPPSLALSSVIPEQSIYIPGISKAFYSGLRIGFVVAPKQYVNKISQAVLDTLWMASPLCAEIVCEVINNGDADRIIAQKIVEIDRRIQIFQRKFRKYEYYYNKHSMFIWFKLPEPWTYFGFEIAARQKGVNIFASDKFTIGSISPPNFIRISLVATESIDEFQDGITRLYDLLTNTDEMVIGIL